MVELARTGFFREMPHGAASDPSLAAARSTTAAPHEDRIAAYLASGRVYVASSSTVDDALAPGTQIGAPHLLTDGKFLWPADLAYYVRTYHIRLEGALLEHMMTNSWTVPEVDLATLAPPALPAPDDRAEAGAAPPKPADLAAVFSTFVEALSGAASQAGLDSGALKKSLEDAGHEVRRAAESVGADLKRAVESAGAQFRTQIGSSLRAFGEFLEKSDTERAAQLKSAMAAIEDKVNELLAPDRPAAEDAKAAPPAPGPRDDEN